MSTTESQPTGATTAGAAVPFSTPNKVGFVVAIVFGLASLVALLFPTPEDEVGPPLPVLAVGALLGLLIIAVVAVGWSRRSRGAIRAAAALLILSAVPALPAFTVPDVSAVLKATAAAYVLGALVAVVLMLWPGRRPT
jgi:O-antigen/teichoic acid export membrane protein